MYICMYECMICMICMYDVSIPLLLKVKRGKALSCQTSLCEFGLFFLVRLLLEEKEKVQIIVGVVGGCCPLQQQSTN